MSVTVVNVDKKEFKPLSLEDLSFGEVIEFPSDGTKGLVYHNTKTGEKEILLLFSNPDDYQTADGYLDELATVRKLGCVKNMTIEVEPVV